MKQQILDEIRVVLGDGYSVTEHEVKKNNGIVLHGIAIAKEGECIAPQIYIDGVPEEDVVEFVVKRYREISKQAVYPQMDFIKSLMTKDGMLANVFPSLVNRAKNNHRLNDIVHRPYLDMEITYKVSAGEEAYITITNELMNVAGLTEEQLYDAALENIKGKAEVHSILDMLPFEADDEVRDNPPAFVVTNKDTTCGAGMILDSDVIEFFNDTLGDFFIIPSSIHEVLVIPECMGDAKRFAKMLREINKDVVGDAEILSDTLYICRDGKIEVA